MNGENEKRYVATVIRPIVVGFASQFRGITVLGEGHFVARPARFLAFSLYPDVSLMYYDQKLLAIEAKFIDFENSVGAIATAIGQAFLYSRSSYLTSIALLLGNASEEIRNELEEENARLRAHKEPWRIVVPRLNDA